jgi:hypothetical protein
MSCLLFGIFIICIVYSFIVVSDCENAVKENQIITSVYMRPDSNGNLYEFSTGDKMKVRFIVETETDIGFINKKYIFINKVNKVTKKYSVSVEDFYRAQQMVGEYSVFRFVKGLYEIF